MCCRAAFMFVNGCFLCYDCTNRPVSFPFSANTLDLCFLFKMPCQTLDLWIILKHINRSCLGDRISNQDNRQLYKHRFASRSRPALHFSSDMFYTPAGGGFLFTCQQNGKLKLLYFTLPEASAKVSF